MRNKKVKRFIDIISWLPSYIGWLLSGYRRERSRGTFTDIIFLLVDHFEPAWNNASPQEEQRRMDLWYELYAQTVDGIFDSDGLPPQHTWFYPYEELNLDSLQKLSCLSFDGFGEIELHLHHFNDTSSGLKTKLADALEKYSQVGALVSIGHTLKYNFGFVHGNWALDNSLSGLCGVNDELSILRDFSCYADFTFPAPNRAQPREVNSIFYAMDNPTKPKSYNTGKILKKTGNNHGDLLIFQGPLIIDLDKGIFNPRIEDGEIAEYKPFNQLRVEKWLKANIHVCGQPDWLFIKAFTHGAMPGAPEILLGNNGKMIYQKILERLKSSDFRFHFATARQAYNIAIAAADGHEGNPQDYRDYVIKPYVNSRIKCNLFYHPLKVNDNMVELDFPVPVDKVLIEFKGYPVKKIEGALQSIKMESIADKQTRVEINASSRVVYDIMTKKEINSLDPSQIISKSSSSKGFEYRLQTFGSAHGMHRLNFKIK